METGTPIGTEQTVESRVEPEAEPVREPATPGARRFRRVMAWLDHQPMVIYSLVMALGGLVLRIPIIAVAVALGIPDTPVDKYIGEYPVLFLVYIAILVPLIETLLFQWLPIGLMARFVTKKVWPQVVVSTVAFSLWHLPNITQALGAIVGGLILAWTYVIWFGRGRHKGYWAACLIHAWNNLIAGLLVLASLQALPR
jgi:membrane protease YdiL (CAAX protease family)